jgi:hypothetical protein
MSKQVSMLITPTQEECVAACVKEGMPAREGEKLFIHYSMCGWRYGKGKVAITSLSLVVKGWRLRWEEKGCPDTNGHKLPDPNSGVILLAKSKELERIEQAITTLKSWRDARNGVLSADEKQRWNELQARKKELKSALGIKF